EPRQEAIAAGIAVQLERVVVTPSETRAWLRADPPARAQFRQWSLASRLVAPGADGERIGNSFEVPAGAGLWMVTFPTPPAAPGGAWTLTIQELIGFPARPGGSTPQLRRIAGPWVFSFNLPGP